MNTADANTLGATACGPHCPDVFPHLHYYGEAGTRFPAAAETELQQRPPVSDEAYLEQRLGPRPTLDTRLATFQAADIANVSRAEIMRLLDAGEIPWERPGRHRLIRCRDLIAYLRADDARRMQAADELSRLGQEIHD
jgi:excisionase family DNA binding protein